MNGNVIPGSNFTIPAKGYVLLPPTEEPMYRQYKPAAKDIVPLPNAVLYMLMAVLVVGVAYAIVGHLIKNLAIDLAECVLGPTGDEEKEKENNPQTMASSQPPAVHPFAYNAFHVWDQDGVVIALPLTESPQVSPMLLASIPYIPSFFPHTHSPTSHSSQALFNSPGPVQDLSI